MTPSNATTKKTQRTVFDLASFDDVKLVKEFSVPAKPTSLEEALAAVGNDQTKLLDVIHSGLVSAAADAAYNDINGFKVVGEDGEPGEAYSGKFADEEMGKKINAAILSLAKLQGYDKSLTPEKKREIKETATNFLRNNPALLQSIAG